MKVCEKLKIKYKVIYDYDTLYSDNCENYSKNIVSDYIKTLIKKIKIDINLKYKKYNEIIEILKDKNIFIWDENIIEIEGIKFKLFGEEKELYENNGNFNMYNYKQNLENENKDLNLIKNIKNDNKKLSNIFKSISHDDIEEAIIKKCDNKYLKNLLDFLKK